MDANFTKNELKRAFISDFGMQNKPPTLRFVYTRDNTYAEQFAHAARCVSRLVEHSRLVLVGDHLGALFESLKRRVGWVLPIAS